MSIGAIRVDPQLPSRGVGGPVAAAGTNLIGAVAVLARDRGGLLGMIVVSSLVIAAILAPLLVPYDPLAVSADLSLGRPSLAHPFGTDDLGRDVLARVLIGARISLGVSSLSAFGALAVAVPLGMLAGYVGGAVDAVIARLFDTILAFPAVLLGIGMVALLGSGIANVVIAVIVISVPTLGRLARVAVISQRREEYIEAARAAGSTATRVLVRHIFPNAAPALIVQTTLVMADAVLLEAAFSFLGLGSRPPTPSWGTMLDSGRTFLNQAPWLGLFPGLAMTLTILGLNALGDALREALNPRRRMTGRPA